MPKFDREASIFEKASRIHFEVLVHENPARQKTKRAFERAHIGVGNENIDTVLAKNGLDQRNQNEIIRSQKFDHMSPETFTSPCRKTR